MRVPRLLAAAATAVAVLSGPTPAFAAAPTVVAVGDAACDPGSSNFNGGKGTATACRQASVAAGMASRNPSALIMLGDAQYENGTLAKYLSSYDLAFGRFKGITKPVIGNHERRTSGAAGHFAYFGNPKPYYAWNPAPGWRAYVLDSTCTSTTESEACTPSRAQLDWLKADLAANPSTCVLAAWHHPRWSSGSHGNQPNTSAFYTAMHQARAELVLSGHDHQYQRYHRRLPNGTKDATGLRQFVVGTGGKEVKALSRRSDALAAHVGAHGFLELELSPGSYTYRFRDIGGVVRDSGTTACRA